jgi:hypothetical protein
VICIKTSSVSILLPVISISRDVIFYENNGYAVGAQYTSDVLLLSDAVSGNNSSTNVDQSLAFACFWFLCAAVATRT